jgi:hypothetical protein
MPRDTRLSADRDLARATIAGPLTITWCSSTNKRCDQLSKRSVRNPVGCGPLRRSPRRFPLADRTVFASAPRWIGGRHFARRRRHSTDPLTHVNRLPTCVPARTLTVSDGTRRSGNLPIGEEPGGRVLAVPESDRNEQREIDGHTHTAVRDPAHQVHRFSFGEIVTHETRGGRSRERICATDDPRRVGEDTGGVVPTPMSVRMV